jgi:quercetin dioxygenase-like cupin family protein
MVSEEQFRQMLRERGYGEVQFKDYPPNADGPMHTHDFSVLLLVVDGDFMLAQDDGVKTYRPGEICDLPAGSTHVERSGSNGARILLGKK